LRVSTRTINYSAAVLLLLGLMVTESVLFNHDTFSKADAYFRLQTLREQIPASLPEDPILFNWNSDNIPWYLTELDAMLLSQDLGWPVMNGYSGNLPKGYGPTTNCDQAIARIISYMNFENMRDPSLYNNLISRVVSVGPEKCQWPKNLQNNQLITLSSGAFSQELFSGISINILSMAREGNSLSIQVDIENHSSLTLPAESSSENIFRLSWRMIDAKLNNPVSGFDSRKNLFFDIPAGGHALMTIVTDPPVEEGEYLVEVSAVQEFIAWFHDRGMLPARSAQTIKVEASGQWSISD